MNITDILESLKSVKGQLTSVKSQIITALVALVIGLIIGGIVEKQRVETITTDQITKLNQQHQEETKSAIAVAVRAEQKKNETMVSTSKQTEIRYVNRTVTITNKKTGITKTEVIKDRIIDNKDNTKKTTIATDTKTDTNVAIKTDTKVKDSSVSSTETKTVTVMPSKSRFSLGVEANTPELHPSELANINSYNKFSQYQLGLTGGVRIIDNVWADVNYRPMQQLFQYGLKYQLNF